MIISRYIAKDLIASTVAVTLVLLLVIVSGRFVDYLADAAAGEIPAELLSYLLLYKLPGFFQLILPLGFFISVMLIYGRLYVDSEMVVLQACGFGQTRLLFTAFWPTLLITAIVAYCSLFVAPAGELKLRQEMEKPSATTGFSTLVAGKFQYIGSGLTVYVRELNSDKTKMQGVFVVHEQQDGGRILTNIAIADSAHLVPKLYDSRYLVLEQGRQYRGVVGALERSQIQFGELAIKLPESSRRSIKPASADALSTMDLLADPIAENKAALHWRLSTPVMVVLMTIIGFSLSRTSHRKGRYGKLLPGIILFFIYFTALSAVRGLMEDGKNLSLGMLPIHAVMLVIALFIFWGERSLVWFGYLLGKKSAGATHA